MESEFFLNTGLQPPSLLQQQQTSMLPLQHHFEPTKSPVPTWQHPFSDQSPAAADCFLGSKSTEHHNHGLNFDSALASMLTSPNTPIPRSNNMSNECFMIRELIGKLGNIDNNNIFNNTNTSYVSTTNTGNNSANTSCYSTPLSSPPKLSLPVMDNFPKPMALNSTVAEFTADPGFAERAAKFSCFGSRSFNGRTSQFGGLNNNNLNINFDYKTSNGNANSVMGNGKLSRVSSSPALKVMMGSQRGNKNSALQDQPNSSQEESSLSHQQIPVNDHFNNSKKRKCVSKGKAKEALPNATKDSENNKESNGKRMKPDEGDGQGNGSVKAEEDSKNGNSDDEKQNKDNSKPPEPPKDYIHVRARRGQATDSHSLAERVRREKISERMNLLQDLVPGCNKVTGKALMLDEIINYVQSLQRQVEFLSMKLASVNTRLDFNMDTLIPKDIFQSSNNAMQHPMFPLDSSTSAIFGHQPPNNSNGTMDPMGTVDNNVLCEVQLPQFEGFNQIMPQYPSFSEGELHTIVQMGLAQNVETESNLTNDT